MLIVNLLSLARVVQHSPFQSTYVFAYAVQARWVISQIVCIHVCTFVVQCGRMCMTTITLRIQNLTLSSLKWSPTNIHTSAYIHIKLLPVSCVFRGRSGSPRITIIWCSFNKLVNIILLMWMYGMCWPIMQRVCYVLVSNAIHELWLYFLEVIKSDFNVLSTCSCTFEYAWCT